MEQVYNHMQKHTYRFVKDINMHNIFLFDLIMESIHALYKACIYESFGTSDMPWVQPNLSADVSIQQSPGGC